MLLNLKLQLDLLVINFIDIHIFPTSNKRKSCLPEFCRNAVRSPTHSRVGRENNTSSRNQYTRSTKTISKSSTEQSQGSIKKLLRKTDEHSRHDRAIRVQTFFKRVFLFIELIEKSVVPIYQLGNTHPHFY